MSPSVRFHPFPSAVLLAICTTAVQAEVTGTTTITGSLLPFQRSFVTTVLTNDGITNEGDLTVGAVNFRQFIPELLEVDRVTATGGSVRMTPVTLSPGFEGTHVEWNGVVCGTTSPCPRTVTIVAEVFPRLGAQGLFFDTFADVIFPASDPSPSASNTEVQRVSTLPPLPLAPMLAARGNQVLAKPCGVAAFERIGIAGLVAGDFDRDGYEDLAVGIPQRTVSSVAGAGAVCVMHGGPTAFSPPSRVVFLHHDVLGVAGAVQVQGGFGQELTMGDFNGDGFADLVVGAPFYDFGPSGVDSGAVWVFFGSSTGLRTVGSRSFTQSTFPGEGLETGDRFGQALAAGDFDADGLDDLAISAPFEDLPSAVDAGSIHVARSAGSGNPLSLLGTHLGQGTRIAGEDFPSGFRTVVETPEAGDRYGSALAAGNLRAGPGAELAVSSPFETVASAGQQATGVVEVYEFSPSGLAQVYVHQGSQDSMRFGTALVIGDLNADDFDALLVASEETVAGAARAGSLVILARTPALEIHFVTYRMPRGLFQGFDAGETPEASDLFAAALAVGDFNGDGVPDLAAGVPGEDIGATVNAGMVHAFYSVAGFAMGGRQLWNQQVSGMTESAEASDAFGLSLAAGDFDGDGFDDLAIGIPGEEIVGGATDQGIVQVLFGGGGR